MRTKTVKVSVRIDEKDLELANHLVEQVSKGNDIELGIHLENHAKNKMSIMYIHKGEELNGTFVDREVCEHLMSETSNAVVSGKIYMCVGKIVGCSLSSNNQRILIDLSINLSSGDEEYLLIPPSPLSSPQEYTPIPGKLEPQKYEIRIVGIRHHASEEAYASLTEFSRNRGDVYLRHEADNKQDPKAVAVYLPSGEKVGYVASQYLPVVYPEVTNGGEIVATVTYMEYEGASATALLKFESGVSAMATQLFSCYTPAEVYKASYLYRQWGGVLEPGEKALMATDEQRINFDAFFALDVSEQNQIAAEWDNRMHKATVENPTNAGRQMNVLLDLSVYGISWKELDLANMRLIQTIELDNKMVAIYFRYRRTEPGGMMVSPQEFTEEVVKVSASEELMKRLAEVFEKKMC